MTLTVMLLPDDFVTSITLCMTLGVTKGSVTPASINSSVMRIKAMVSVKKITSIVPIIVIVATFCTTITGCTPEEEQKTVAALQSGLSSLVQNRTLAEQFVRDVKASVGPNEPGYQQAMESYNEARDSYNHFLDVAESAAKEGHISSRQAQLAVDAQDSTADFFQDATRALKPALSTRGVDFRRAVIIPEDLQRSLGKLPKRDRQSLVDQVDKQVRWRSWDEV
jgi:hypothetical protein